MAGFWIFLGILMGFIFLGMIVDCIRDYCRGEDFETISAGVFASTISLAWFLAFLWTHWPLERPCPPCPSPHAGAELIQPEKGN